jgi:lipopolysaccharide transport system ATP-binding protein
MEYAIDVKGLSKKYKIGEITSKTLVSDIHRFWDKIRGKENSTTLIGKSQINTSNNEFFWALKDIDLSIKQGEVWGIIGPNGAGKSTLLKILSRITKPTSGEITINGRIASLLEVGTGFHPEMTGRENIYMNGAIMGMRKLEINSKLDEIIEFSGVQRYIDTPVKRYSSGMKVRLGFAVAAHLEPEILIVDEVLAVGDAEFQKKCLGKMKEVSNEKGRTVLFVSHNMSAVTSLCSKGLLIKQGICMWNGTISEAIAKYNGDVQFKSNYKFKVNKELEACLSEINIVNIDNKPVNTFSLGDSIRINVFVKVNTAIRNFVVSIGIMDALNYPIRTTWMPEQSVSEGNYEISFSESNLFFASGTYKIVLGLSAGKQKIQYVDDGIFFYIDENSNFLEFNLKNKNQKTGFILNPMDIQIQRK